jgi:hypothetical protein
MDQLGGGHVGLFDDPSAPPIWQIGDTTVNPGVKGKEAKDAPKLLETLESWLPLRNVSGKTTLKASSGLSQKVLCSTWSGTQEGGL